MAIATAAAATSWACVSSEVSRCASGYSCPRGLTCIDTIDQCADPEQLAACSGQDSGTLCETSSIEKGACFGGACIPAGCGNGVVEGNEVCDDGNQIAGDGCNDSCSSTETCGNGILDLTQGEECDCGTEGPNFPPGCDQPNGTTFDVQCTPECRDPSGVVLGLWGPDASTLYAGGAAGVLSVYDGTNWTRAPVTFPGAITGIWGDGPDNIWAISPSETLIYDGVEFTTNLSTGYQAIWGPGNGDPTSMIAAGVFGKLARWSGTTWELESTQGQETYRGLWGSAPDDVFAVGGGGQIAHYDGSQWSLMTTPTDWDLRAVWGTGPNDVFAVGTRAIAHYDGVSWTEMIQPGPVTLHDVWGTSGTDVFAAGEGAILRYNGSEWYEMTFPIKDGGMNTFTSVWGTGPTNIYAVGERRDMLHYDGTSWRFVSGACQPPTTLACGDEVFGSTAGNLATIDEYSCTPFQETGPEAFYSFTPDTNTTAHLMLSDATADLDVFVLEAQSTSGLCDPARCVEFSASLTDEVLEAELSAGLDYYIVVEGFEGAEGSFTLSLECE